MRIVFRMSLILPILALFAAAWWLLKQPFVIPNHSEPASVDATRLEQHVRALSERFYPRSFDHPENLERVASYIRSEFAGSGGRVDEQIFPVEEDRYRNIIARFGPGDGPVVVIGAHYDSVADLMSERVSPETHTPGADDNASGVAGLLELARQLGQTSPPVAVELVAYCLEEPPHFRTDHMGSAWHARALRDGGREVRLMLSLEMIGYFSDKPGSQAYPLWLLNWIYPGRGDFIALAGRFQDWSITRRTKAAMLGATDLPVYSINALPIIPGIDFSDHLNYWNEGFHALMITDTAFYRNPNYHGAGDTAERLDYVRMAKVVQGVYAVIQNY
jgi:Zn-dependent M28 family amino/carboxypeptidase